MVAVAGRAAMMHCRTKKMRFIHIFNISVAVLAVFHALCLCLHAKLSHQNERVYRSTNAQSNYTKYYDCWKRRGRRESLKTVPPPTLAATDGSLEFVFFSVSAFFLSWE